jgi:hypothetical protein
MGRGTTAPATLRRLLPGAVLALALTLLAGLLLTGGAAQAKGKGGLKPPKGVTVTSAATKSLELRWKDTSRGERSFEIKVSPGKRTVKARSNATGASVGGLKSGVRYSIQIRACKGKACSRYSKKLSGTTIPKERPLLGFNEDITRGAPGNDLLAGSGADFVRVPISWANIQPTGPLTYNWAPIDAIHDELAAHGLKPLWVLSSAPCWAQLAPIGCRASDTAQAPNPLFYGTYGNMVVQLAKRYPDSTGIQVWNEPNIPKFWLPTPSATDYRALLKQTLSAVSANNVKVPIVFGAPSPVEGSDAKEDPRKIPTNTFLSGALKGGMPGLDAVALHPYSFNEAGDQVAFSIKRFDQAAAVLDRVAPELPVWVTEVGFTTAGKFRVSKTEQADDLIDVYLALVKRGVDLITVHRFFDQPDPLYIFDAGMGVVAADAKTPKPAYCALALTRGESLAKGC